MEELCPNCFEEIEKAGKCSKCDGLYCKTCANEKMTCPHCGEEDGWSEFI